MVCPTIWVYSLTISTSISWYGKPIHIHITYCNKSIRYKEPMSDATKTYHVSR